MRWRRRRTCPGSCVCVGSLDRDPAFAEGLRRRSLDDGLGDRVYFPGPRTGADLDRSYAAADVLVLASRAETYGMVVTEALARGLPVVAAEVGGLPEALGHGADGMRPGLLVPPGDPAALGAALRAWLGDAGLRRRLRRAARERRASLDPLVDHHVRPRGRPGRCVAMSVEEIRVSRGWLALREPADAAGARPRPRRAPRAAPAGGRVPGDPRPRLRHAGRWAAGSRRCCPARSTGSLHDRDADLLEIAATDLPGPAADGADGHRRGEVVRRHPAAPGRSRRRYPHHGLGAAGSADPGRAGRVWSPPAPAPAATCC